MRRCVLYFVKYPEPGKVKTRLAATVGAERAAAIYRTLAERVLRRLPEAEEVVVMIDPPEQAGPIAEWLGKVRPHLRYLTQASGDLGVRLAHAFDTAFASGFDAVAAIGTDCVELGPEHFTEAWAALATHDAALGPAVDGGYYLLALRAPHPELFHGIAWSTDIVRSQTLDRAARVGLRVHLLPMLHDVDTEADWKRVEG